MSTQRAIGAVYSMFSSLLQPPDHTIYDEIRAGRPGEISNAAAAVLVGSGVSREQHGVLEVPHGWAPSAFPQFEQWRALYKQANAPANPRLQPIESVHKVWTSDPSCEMPFAREKGLLQGDAAHHLYQLYRELGFELPRGYADCPDHLILELEFMGVLVEEAEPRMQSTFLEQHLDWVPTLIEDAERKQVAELYLELLRWIERFLELERARIGAEQSA